MKRTRDLFAFIRVHLRPELSSFTAPSWGLKALPGRTGSANANASGGSVCRSQPSEDKEVAAAESASKGQENPVEDFFNGIPKPYASEVDRPAMGTPCQEHTFQYLDSLNTIG
jgi:hypothetical protein